MNRNLLSEFEKAALRLLFSSFFVEPAQFKRESPFFTSGSLIKSAKHADLGKNPSVARRRVPPRRRTSACERDLAP